MRRSRRSVLTSLAGGVALLSGCSSGGQSETEQPSAGTPTVTFATAAGDTDAPATSGTPTETPDAVGQALAASRTHLETATRRLDAAAVVENGAVGLTSEDAFAEYARVDSPRRPVRDARDRLDAVSDRATGDRQRAVNALLFLCEYLEARADEHDAIVDGFSSYYQVNRAFPEELKLETAARAVGRMRDLRESARAATEALDRVEPRADALGTAGFELAVARERQRTFRAIAREFEPGFAGTRSVLRAVGLASATAPAIERGEYERAERFATSVVTAAANGLDYSSTALDRDVRHFGDAFEQDRCLADGMRTVGEQYVASARAYLDDRPETGRERYRAAKEALASTETECGIEL